MHATTAVRRSKPEIRQFFPIWWHHRGSKMRVVEFDAKERRLVIAASAAKVIIRPCCEVQEGGDGWIVDWEVIQRIACDEAVRGRRHFHNDELAAAFGLTDDSSDFGQWLLDRFGGDSAEQGRYIRWQHFLNIPCPGSGHDGDPNVSLEIDNEMSDAVRQLLV